MAKLAPRFSIIIGFRNREVSRVRHVLDALSKQKFDDFELIFVDYGSDDDIRAQAHQLVTGYAFSKYIYSDTKGWYWNRSHAQNTGIKLALGEIIVISDIDLIFPVDFLRQVNKLTFDNTFYTFNCYYLPAETNCINVTQDDLQNSIINYVGLCAVSKDHLLTISGFDEYYLNWGGEDDDLYARLENNNCYKQQLSVDTFPVLHQWHQRQSPSYPTSWYLDMVNYLYSVKSQAKEVDKPYGLLVETTQRVVLHKLKDTHRFKRLELFPNPLFQFNLFLDEFFKMEKGGLGLFEFPIDAPLPKGRKQKLIERINKQLSKYHISYYIQRITLKMPVYHKQTWLDFVQYFIGRNRHLVSDYYLLNTDEKLVLYFQKK